MMQTDAQSLPRAAIRPAAPVPPTPPAFRAAATADLQGLSRIIADLCASAGMRAALHALDAMVAASPRNGNLRGVQGQLLSASGRHEQAVSALSRAVSLGADMEFLHLLANATYPGPHYHEHLRAVHEALRPATYLEVGVFQGDALALALPPTRAIGVDPMPRSDASRAYAAPTRIHVVTSDAFFAAMPADGPKRLRVDLAFIDGLHLFEQVLRDFINVERCCHPGSVVVLHDTLPVAAAGASRKRDTRYWCGDVWKMLPCLRRYRPDLQLLTIPTYPSGLTLVRGLDPGSRVLSEAFGQAVARYRDRKLPASRTPPAYRGEVANDLQQVRAWLLPN